MARGIDKAKEVIDIFWGGATREDLRAYSPEELRRLLANAIGLQVWLTVTVDALREENYRRVFWDPSEERRVIDDESC